MGYLCLILIMFWNWPHIFVTPYAIGVCKVAAPEVPPVEE